MDQESSVSNKTGYRLDNLHQIPSRHWDSSLHHHIQNDSEAHPASYSMGNEAFFLRIKWLKHGTDHSSQSSAEVWNVCSFTSISPTQQGA